MESNTTADTAGLQPSALSKALNISANAVHKELAANNVQVIKTGHRRSVIPSMGVNKILLSRGYKYPRHNISFQAVKGGVGKTTCAFLLALRASSYGARVLFLDIEKQGNASRTLLSIFGKYQTHYKQRPIFLDVIKDRHTIQDCVISLSEHLHLIHSSLENTLLEHHLGQKDFDYKTLINDMLKPIRKNYDLVVMDCPPDINKIHLIQTCAAHKIFIPVLPSDYGIEGVENIIATINATAHRFNLELEYVLINNCHVAGQIVSENVLDFIKEQPHLSEHLYPHNIRRDSNVENSIYEGVSLFDKFPRTRASKDFDRFTRYVLGLNYAN